METQDKVKRNYKIPVIEQIMLDNEISLILESAPPSGPNEASIFHEGCINNSPFKDVIV